MKFIITAGGTGTKMWPLSRDAKPKQFQNIVGAKSLFQQQVDTLIQGAAIEDIFVSTKEQYVDLVTSQSPQILKSHIIVEPNAKKNRGPGEGYAVLKVDAMYPGEPFMIIQSDVLRTPDSGLWKMVNVMDSLVRRDRKFISTGQKAIYPDMGSDYLQLGERVKFGGDVEIYQVEKFVYRLGDYAKTKELIENFRVSTHTNHNCWFPELLMEAYAQYKPEWHEALMQIRDSFGTPNESEVTNQIYAQMSAGPTEDVTRHVFEQGYIMLNPFKWMDFGTWDSVYEHLAKSGEVYAEGNVVSIDSRNSLVKAGSAKLVATLGIDNLVVVDAGDVLLVCAKDRTGDIKLILDEIVKRDLQQFL